MDNPVIRFVGSRPVSRYYHPPHIPSSTLSAVLSTQLGVPSTPFFFRLSFITSLATRLYTEICPQGSFHLHGFLSWVECPVAASSSDIDVPSHLRLESFLTSRRSHISKRARSLFDIQKQQATNDSLIFAGIMQINDNVKMLCSRVQTVLRRRKQAKATPEIVSDLPPLAHFFRKLVY